MSVKLHKEHIKLSKMLGSPSCQTTLENDIIVPDIKPDILKILGVESQISSLQKNIQTDRIFVSGTVNINILYVPDNDCPGAIKSISTSREFNHTLDAPGIVPGMDVSLDVQCISDSCTLVNSRKVNVRSRLSISARLMGYEDMEVVCGLEDCSDIEVLGKEVSICNLAINQCRDIIIREKIEVPQGMCSIGEILNLPPKAQSTELRFSADKAAVKGDIKICTLYCSESAEPTPEVMEHTVPFGQVLEIPGLRENMAGEVDYSAKNVFWEVCRDSDGDRRVISIELTLEAHIRAFEVVHFNALCDAYGLESPVELSTCDYSIEEFIDSCCASENFKEQICVPDYLPDVWKLCEVTGMASIQGVSVEGCTATVDGLVDCSFMYLSKDASAPVICFNHIIPFRHIFEIPGLKETSVCDAKVDVEHISCTISGDKGLEVRGIVHIQLKAINLTTINLVCDIEECEGSACDPSSAIIYFAREGDTIWDVAKRYRVPVSRIAEANNLTENQLKKGSCIYIFK